jgi:hypothetical protein
MSSEKIKAAITSLRTGDRVTGRRILTEVLQESPRDEIAWLWMTACTDSRDQKQYCLNRVLEIDPENNQAKEALAKFSDSDLPMPTLDELNHSAITEVRINDRTSIKEIHADSSNRLINKDEFINLACPSCGGKLEINLDSDRYKCIFCGSAYLVRRQGSSISLEPVIHEIRQVRNSIDETTNEVRNVKGSVDITAAELAISRLRTEIQNLEFKMEKLDKPLNSSLTFLLGGGLMWILAISADINEFWCTTGSLVMAIFGLLGTMGVVASRSQIKQSIAQREAEIKKHMHVLGG